MMSDFLILDVTSASYLSSWFEMFSLFRFFFPCEMRKSFFRDGLDFVTSGAGRASSPPFVP